jgi:hypothetical protein
VYDEVGGQVQAEIEEATYGQLSTVSADGRLDRTSRRVARADLSRRVEKVVGYPPSVERNSRGAPRLK